MRHHLVGVGRLAPLARQLDRRGVPVLPAALQGVAERERLHRRARLDQLSEQALAGLRRLPLARGACPHRTAGAPGQQHEQREADQQDPGDRRRQDEYQDEKQHREGKIGEQRRGRTGHGVAHDVGIPEQRLPVGGGAPLQHPQRQAHDLVVERAADGYVERDGDRLEDAAPRLTQHVVEQDDDRHADHQPLQRADARMEDDAVVDLQHEDRRGQRQQIHEQRDEQRIAERAAGAAQGIPQPAPRRGIPNLLMRGGHRLGLR